MKKMQGWDFVYLPSLLHVYHPYLVCMLFGVPSLHLFYISIFFIYKARQIGFTIYRPAAMNIKSGGEACQARAIQITNHRKSREYGIGMTNQKTGSKFKQLVRMRIWYWTTNLKIPVSNIKGKYIHALRFARGAVAR